MTVTESHTSLLRPSSVQHDLWLSAKSPVSRQSQGQTLGSWRPVSIEMG